MRRLRREAGKTREEAARFADIAPATVSRIEAATHAPKVADIMALCRFYELDEEHTEELVALARQSRQRGWWQKFGRVVPDWFQIYVGIEEEASSLKIYESEVVPGLLQTESYATATHLAEPVLPDETEIARRVLLRMERQKRLLEADDAPDVWVVLSEAVLRRQVGGKVVMREQLQHLNTLSRRPNIMLQVLPFATGAHPGMEGSFTILGFPESTDLDVVYMEYRQGSLYLEGREEIDGYTLMYSHLCAQALGRDETRALIEQVADEMG